MRPKPLMAMRVVMNSTRAETRAVFWRIQRQVAKASAVRLLRQHSVQPSWLALCCGCGRLWRFPLSERPLMSAATLPFSLLELASVPTGSDIRHTLLELRRYAQAADKLGLTRLWLAEHHNMEGIA